MLASDFNKLEPNDFDEALAAYDVYYFSDFGVGGLEVAMKAKEASYQFESSSWAMEVFD